MAADRLRRLTLPDRVEIVVGDAQEARVGLISVVRRPRWIRLGLGAIDTGAVALAAWWLFWDGPAGIVVVAGILSGWLHTAWEKRKRLVLTDPVLVQAAVRAARALGREVQPGRWQIDVPQADSLGREFARLHTLRTSREGDADWTREQALLDAAIPELRAFMQPTLPGGGAALEPFVAEPSTPARNHEPGQPWPVLPPPVEGTPGQ